MSDKDWSGNSVSYMKTSGFQNGSLTERNERDYYATDPKAGKLLLTLDTFSNIWECAAGGGSFSRGVQGGRSAL